MWFTMYSMDTERQICWCLDPQVSFVGELVAEQIYVPSESRCSARVVSVLYPCCIRAFLQNSTLSWRRGEQTTQRCRCRWPGWHQGAPSSAWVFSSSSTFRRCCSSPTCCRLPSTNTRPRRVFSHTSSQWYVPDFHVFSSGRFSIDICQKARKHRDGEVSCAKWPPNVIIFVSLIRGLRWSSLIL